MLGEADGWRPRAVVFDCDGLLVDTESCWTAAEAALCARRGVTFADADAHALVGASIPHACRLLAGLLDDGSTPEAIERELTSSVAGVVARDAEAMAGAPELVALARARVPVAVASNSTRTLLDQALERGGVAGSFDATVAADEVERPKPAPDLYLAACTRLGVAPGDAVAFEDSATGIRAAAAAGLRTIGVPTLVGADIGAELGVDSLADPRLLSWVRGWSLR